MGSCVVLLLNYNKQIRLNFQPLRNVWNWFGCLLWFWLLSLLYQLTQNRSYSYSSKDILEIGLSHCFMYYIKNLQIKKKVLTPSLTIFWSWLTICYTKMFILKSGGCKEFCSGKHTGDKKFDPNLNLFIRELVNLFLALSLLIISRG